MGPLTGITVVEMSGLAPGPFCAMMLADLGARVITVDRPGGSPLRSPALQRSRESIVVDLKHAGGPGVVVRLAARADAFIEGFRPGVAERLGIGPEECMEANPRLVYGRITGWGRDGPLAATAGHDIDYIALSGALFGIGPPDRPVPPLTYAGDFGGGGMLLAVGILAALVERGRSGAGQVVDAAMVDGSALLTALVHGMRTDGAWEDARQANLLDGGAPFYTTYECSDGRHVAVGSLEPRFYDELLSGLGLSAADLPDRFDRTRWPELRAQLAAVFATRTRDEWAEHFAAGDACVAPVLGPGEAPEHPHLAARGTFVEVGGRVQPAPAPRFGRTPAPAPARAPEPGEHTDAVLTWAGYGPDEIGGLRGGGAVA
jgi:alpha-methylacyl-CoA racemase